VAWEPAAGEFEAIRSAEPLTRYGYFVEHAIETEIIHTLGDERELALVDDPGGTRYVCLWPHEKYAESERERDWARYDVISFDLETWLGRLLPDLASSGESVGVFPVWDRGAWVMAADELVEELRAAAR
jgi:hypothetical protein